MVKSRSWPVNFHAGRVLLGDKVRNATEQSHILRPVLPVAAAKWLFQCLRRTPKSGRTLIMLYPDSRANTDVDAAFSFILASLRIAQGSGWTPHDHEHSNLDAASSNYALLVSPWFFREASSVEVMSLSLQIFKQTI
jgi:hypothetical protein